MLMPSEQMMRAAVAEKDGAFNGVFVYGVITTGVFCLPSCSSRPAKDQNLRFFANTKAAMQAGFRPCKRCQPNGESHREQLVTIARYIEAHASERITLPHLAAMAALSASRFQRVFKAAFGLSPKAYQDAIRMRQFKQSLKGMSNVTDAIYASGFSSSSRVYGEVNRSIGMHPKAYQTGAAGEHIAYACRHTSLGLIMMAATDKGVCFVQFGEHKASLIQQLKEEFPKAEVNASLAQEASALDSWIDALDEHISHNAPRPDIPLDIRGTVFQQTVWRFLLSIREGDIVSYSELATQIGKPKAFRAAASACAKNRIGVLIPCHRVLRGDGSLGGYRWGLERKQRLLDAEKERRSQQTKGALDGQSHK